MFHLQWLILKMYVGDHMVTISMINIFISHHLMFSWLPFMLHILLQILGKNVRYIL